MTQPTAAPIVERLLPQDLEELAALYRTVAAEVPPGRLQRRDAANLASYLAGGSACAFGVRHEGRLVATGLLGLPKVHLPIPMPRFPGIPAEDWPDRVGMVESAVVLPEARGRGYQRHLLQARADAARTLGRRWLVTGVHFANLPSWRNLRAFGFHLAIHTRALGEPIAGLLLCLDLPPQAAAA